MARCKNGVGDGARTHDRWNHNPELCQLSYAHHCSGSLFYRVLTVLQTSAHCRSGFSRDQMVLRKQSRLKPLLQHARIFPGSSPPGHSSMPPAGFNRIVIIGAPGRTRTCNPRLSLPLQFSLPRQASSWSGLSLHLLRCCTYSLYGALR